MNERVSDKIIEIEKYMEELFVWILKNIQT